eukprot:maker-scaffold372_size192401-snap-gene-0.39 protein:Tk00574 transcript:maker-scaffold372_size192401-snap-gene-0.39-mRNA-1 annotation:"upf0513 transmembrane protein"
MSSASSLPEEDGAPSHTAVKTQKFCKDNFADFWDKTLWPTSSPDLNPLDYSVWSVLESKVGKTSHRNVEELQANISKHWSEMSADYIVATCAKFRPRVEAVIEASFWIKVDEFREQPEFHFKHELLLHLDTLDPEQPLGWSTFKNYNQMINSHLRVPTIRSSEPDDNGDGKLDALDLRIEIPLGPEEQVLGATLFLIFDAKLHRLSSVQFQGLAYIQAHSALSASGLTVYGDLHVVQKQPIAARGRDLRFEYPIFNPESTNVADFDFSRVLRDYAHRNVSTRIGHDYSLWRRGTVGQERPFVLDLHLRYQEQTIYYTPGLWQVLKWAWVQYLAIAVLFVLLFRSVKAYIFTQQVFPVVQHKELLL